MITEATNVCGWLTHEAYIDVINNYSSSYYSTYPNPTNGILTIKKENKGESKKLNNDKTSETLRLQLHASTTGVLVKEVIVNLSGETSVDVSNLPNGNYILSIRKEGKLIESKDIIIKK